MRVRTCSFARHAQKSRLSSTILQRPVRNAQQILFSATKATLVKKSDTKHSCPLDCSSRSPTQLKDIELHFSLKPRSMRSRTVHRISHFPSEAKNASTATVQLRTSTTPPINSALSVHPTPSTSKNSTNAGLSTTSQMSTQGAS